MLAESEQERKAAQPGQHEDQGASAAKPGQGQGQHAGAHVHAVRKRQAIVSRLAHPASGRIFAVGIAHGSGRGELDEAQRVQRMHLGLRTRKWRRPIASRHLRTRRYQHHRRHASGEQPGQRDRTDPATGDAGQGRGSPPFDHLHGGQQRQGEADSHHGQEQLAHQQGECRGQSGLDHAQPPATAPGAQTVKQRQVPHRGPGNPRGRMQAQPGCPLGRQVARQGPSQGRDAR